MSNIRALMVDPNKYTKTKLVLMILLLVASNLSTRILGPGNWIGTLIFIFLIIVLTLQAIEIFRQKRMRKENERRNP